MRGTSWPPHPVGAVGPGRYYQPRDAFARPAVYADGAVEPHYPYHPRLTLQLVQFDPIYPYPVRDFRTLDFTTLINNPAIPIQTATWKAEMAPDTPVDDFHPMDRMIDPPTIDPPNYQTTTQLVGDMLNGGRYVLSAQVTLSDGRILVSRGILTCIAESLIPEPLPPGAVASDYAQFITLFPEFRTITPEQYNAYWVMATEILRNDRTSPVIDPEERKEILQLLVAHICALFGGPQGGGGFGPQITGTINSKSVNGVSISGGGMFPGVSGTQAWYQLTRYGQLAWMKLRAYRSFYYVSGPQRDLISPWSSWPWKLGGIGGWGTGGWGGGAIVSIPGPQGATGATGAAGSTGPARVFIDNRSIVGPGNTAVNPLRVAEVEGGDYTDPDTYGATGNGRIRRPRG